MTKNKIYASIIVLLTMLVLVASIPPAKAQFVIAWDYQDVDKGNFDEYGQGLYMFVVLENVTDDEWTPVGAIYYFNETNSFEWEVGYGIKLQIYAWMNSTLTGASDLADGLNYLRMNVTVTGLLGAVLDDQPEIDNYYSSSNWDPLIWLYGFYVVLDILPVQGYIYRVTITYEVYW